MQHIHSDQHHFLSWWPFMPEHVCIEVDIFLVKRNDAHALIHSAAGISGHYCSSSHRVEINVPGQAFVSFNIHPVLLSFCLWLWPGLVCIVRCMRMHSQTIYVHSLLHRIRVIFIRTIGKQYGDTRTLFQFHPKNEQVPPASAFLCTDALDMYVCYTHMPLDRVHDHHKECTLTRAKFIRLNSLMYSPACTHTKFIANATASRKSFHASYAR